MTTMNVETKTRDWDELIRDVVAGRWTDPETGKAARVPFETIHLDDTLAGQEAGLEVLGYTSQARFLLNCGLLSRMAQGTTAERAMAARLIHEQGPRSSGPPSMVQSS